MQQVDHCAALKVAAIQRILSGETVTDLLNDHESTKERDHIASHICFAYMVLWVGPTSRLCRQRSVKHAAFLYSLHGCRLKLSATARVNIHNARSGFSLALADACATHLQHAAVTGVTPSTLKSRTLRGLKQEVTTWLINRCHLCSYASFERAGNAYTVRWLILLC